MLNKIIAYECGELTEIETVKLFAELIENGQAWTLQGHYGRTATRLIEGGYVSREGKILVDLGEANESK